MPDMLDNCPLWFQIFIISWIIFMTVILYLMEIDYENLPN